MRYPFPYTLLFYPAIESGPASGFRWCSVGLTRPVSSGAMDLSAAPSNQPSLQIETRVDPPSIVTSPTDDNGTGITGIQFAATRAAILSIAAASARSHVAL